MTEKHSRAHGSEQVHRRNLGTLGGHQMSKLRKEGKKPSSTLTPENFTPGKTEYAEAYEQAATAGRVAIAGDQLAGYLMPLDSKLAYENGALPSPRPRLPLAFTEEGLLQAFKALPDGAATLFGRMMDNADAIHNVRTALPTRHNLSMKEAVDAGLLAPSMTLAFSEEPEHPGADHSVQGWTDSSRALAAGLLGLQEGISTEEAHARLQANPPDGYTENVEWDTRREQDQPPQGEQ